MGSIAIDKTFTDWRERTSGTGTVSIAGSVVHTQGSGFDSAMIDWYLPVQKGQIVEFSIFAKKVVGDLRVAIDSVNYNLTNVVNLDYITVDTTQWTKYKIKVTIPNNNENGLIRVVLGKWSSLNQSVDGYFQIPFLKVSDGQESDSILAEGLIQVTNGTPTVHNGFKSFGISSMSYSASVLTVTLNEPSYISVRPLVFVSGSVEDPLMPLGGFVGSGGNTTFQIKWSDGSQFVDISTKTVYVFVKVIG